MKISKESSSAKSAKASEPILKGEKFKKPIIMLSDMDHQLSRSK